MDEIIALRRQLHRIAELSGREEHTAGHIREFLVETGPDELTTGIGGCGMVASYFGKNRGPDILIRCELDALPIPEENEVEYRSKYEGIGHQCGHDGHMAIVCGIARHLGAERAGRADVHLLYQPAEETGEGARRVLEDDAFTIDADYVFALHNLPGYKKHSIVVKPDTFASASVGFTASLKGETSHAAHPEKGNSPAPAMSQLIQSLSSIPQFYTGLDAAAKVTVIHAVLGEKAFGTSPGTAKVMATLRTFREDILDSMKEDARRLAEGLAATYRLELETGWVEPFPATVNDRRMVSLVKKVAEQLDFDIIDKETPFGWSEDFGHFIKTAPGAMFGVGAGEDHPALHASNYDFPDNIVGTGIDMFLGIIEELQKI